MNELQTIQGLGLVGGLAVIAWALRPLWAAWGSRLRKNGDDKRITELQNFKLDAEENHFHDLEGLKEDVGRIWQVISKVQNDVGNIRERLAKLETKVFNGYKRE